MTVFVADTNVVIRVILNDDKAQAAAAREALELATMVIVPTIVFCEIAWVLSRIKNDAGGRRYPAGVIAEIIRRFIGFDRLVVSTDEVAVGLAMLDAGGDFADGAIEYTGRSLARNVTTIFLSFDKNAVGTLAKRGLSALLLQPDRPQSA